MLLMIDNRTAHFPFVPGSSPGQALSVVPQARSRRILSCY